MTSRETTLRRLHMRSIRRGIKEMDLILGHFAEVGLSALSDDELAEYEQMLMENDQELFTWMNGQTAPPARFAALVERIRAAARDGVTRA